MTKLAIIGGTGLLALDNLSICESKVMDTPYGKPSAPLSLGQLNGKDIIFLARHGNPHRIPPHKINYRANLWALQQLGVKDIIAVNAVGGILANKEPPYLMLPDQIIDYTYGRIHTFHEDDDLDEVVHIDLTYPYSDTLRVNIMTAAEHCAIPLIKSGVYGCTQGPRLETAAEVIRMERDGCHIIGMTGMPEAALARELTINYACIALIVNKAAGKTANVITMTEIEQAVQLGMTQVKQLLINIIGVSV